MERPGASSSRVTATGEHDLWRRPLHVSTFMFFIAFACLAGCGVAPGPSQVHGEGGSGGQAGAGGIGGGGSGGTSVGGSGGSGGMDAKDCSDDPNCTCVRDCCANAPWIEPSRGQCPEGYVPNSTCTEEMCTCPGARPDDCYACCDRLADVFHPSTCDAGVWSCPAGMDHIRDCACPCEQLFLFPAERCEDGKIVCDPDFGLASGFCGEMMCLGCVPGETWSNERCACNCAGAFVACRSLD